MGNGRGKKPLFPGLESPAIAHNEPAASARGSWLLTFRSEISQGIARRHVGNVYVDQKEKSARAAKRRASSDDHAVHRFSLKQ
jgi:hypothetical protein